MGLVRRLHNWPADNINTSKVIPGTWILLGNQSTHDVFSNPSLLQNIWRAKGLLYIHTQAGTATTAWKGDLDGYGPMWFCKGGIANILSLSKVQERYQVTFDSRSDNEFVVHKLDGQIRMFKQLQRGFYYMDVSKMATTLVNAVAENTAKHANSDYLRALLACRLQKTTGRPSFRSYVQIVEEKKLKNCPVNKDDTVAAEHVFRPDVGSLKGKMVRTSQGRVQASLLPIPAVIMERHPHVTLAADIMKVNGVAFLVSISRAIKFGTVELLAIQKLDTVLVTIKNINNLCKHRGFKLDVMLMDGEFESIRGILSGIGITLNTVSRDEHVSDAERQIRTLKEQCCYTFNTLPFTKLPAQMTVQMVCSSNFWLNVFPPEDGINEMNQRELITSSEIDYEKHWQLEFGTHVQTHDKHDDSVAPRTTGAIAMRPNGNSQGGYGFYSLTTGRLLNWNHWTTLPMPVGVIQRAHQLAKATTPGLHFTDCLNREHGNNDYDPDNEDDEDESLDGSITGVDQDELADLNNNNVGNKMGNNAPDPPDNNPIDNQQQLPAHDNEATDEVGEQPCDANLINNNEVDDDTNPTEDDHHADVPDTNEADQGDHNDGSNFHHPQDNADEPCDNENEEEEEPNHEVNDNIPADDKEYTHDGEETVVEMRPHTKQQLKKLEIEGRTPEVLPPQTRKQHQDGVGLLTVGLSEITGVSPPVDHDWQMADLKGIAITQ